MRKVLSCFLILTMLTTFGGCSKKYESSEINLYDCTLGMIFELTDEQEEELLSLWNESKWGKGLTKTAWDYEFLLDDGYTIRYSSLYGRLADKEGNRSLVLTEEQRINVNSIIVAIAKIQLRTSDVTLSKQSTEASVGLTKEQMQDVLNVFNNSNWEPIYYYSKYEYMFVLEQGISLGYEPENGVFEYFNRNITVSEEQRLLINSIIAQYFSVE